MASKKKIAKKSAKKVVAKKSAKKAAPKKVAAKKAVKKSVKKPIAKKAAVKKTPAKKVAKKAVAKVAVKPTAKPVVSAKPVAKKIDYSKAITPLGDRLVVRVIKGERMTAGGLIIPDMVNSAVGHLKGEVLAIGKGSKNKKGMLRPLDVQVGDEVLFAEFAGTKVEFNAEELQIVHESDVMGIVQK